MNNPTPLITNGFSKTQLLVWGNNVRGNFKKSPTPLFQKCEFLPFEKGEQEGFRSNGASYRTLERERMLSFRATPAKAGGDPESSPARSWIRVIQGSDGSPEPDPRFLEMTEQVTFARSSFFFQIKRIPSFCKGRVGGI
jgi:hypothetical protein